MIAILKAGTPKEQIDNLIRWLENQGLKIHISEGDRHTVLGLVGDTGGIDMDLLASLDIVQDVKRVSEPYKRCSRDFQPQDTVIEIGTSGVKLGGGNFCFIAGPCSVETHEQIIDVAKSVKAAGANILRGGAFKPRTSPYDFQGLGALGIEMLLEAKKETGLPIITEVMNVTQLPLFEDVDIIQIGARNMQNFDLLKEVGKMNKPILLKRGLCATMKEWLMSAEYIMSEGNEQVILCERGIRTYETYTRNTLDLSAVPTLKGLSHLPVVVDPSHATGSRKLVRPMALAAAAAGADGLMIEVHNDPKNALCDGAQSLTPEQFAEVSAATRRVLEAIV
ncbi:MAG: 3-deoxy-7-phosphoheptulonate synthase [Oscillospiraceae bacterium]|nr:3-deoxy-7-phosphoheptulonate synthase [Oscillospiraceae bacterium]